MRTWPRLLACLCLAAFLVATMGATVGSLRLPPGEDGDGVVLAGELEDALREMERIQREMEENQAEFERLQSQEKSVVADINRIQKELDILQSELKKLQNGLSQVSVAIAVTKKEIADAQDRLDVRTDLMLRRIRALSEVGYVNYLEVLLGARSFSDFLTRFELLRQVLDSDVKLFDEVTEEKRQLELKKAYLEEQKAELEAIQADTTSKRAQVAARRAVQDRLLAQLKVDKNAIAQAQEELERTSKELARYIVQLQSASGEKPSFRWPLDGTLTITSRFGPRFHPILKVWKNHDGIDLAAPTGRAIKASAAGKVILAAWAGGYGKCVIIDHGAYWSTLYAHLSVIEVKVGTVVTQGQTIGLVGSTGYSTGPHLHFEIRFRGDPVNPEEHLARR